MSHVRIALRTIGLLSDKFKTKTINEVELKLFLPTLYLSVIGQPRKKKFLLKVVRTKYFKFLSSKNFLYE